MTPNRISVKRAACAAFLLVLFLLGVGGALAVGETTGTVVACATATTPAHTVAVDGGTVDVIPGDVASNCVTSTYTVPTSTETVTGPTTTVTSTATSSTTSTTIPTTTTFPTTTTTPGGGNGTITFDGTFSPTDPPSGPHWLHAYGTCYSYVNPNQLSMTPLSSCSPESHFRTDICSAAHCNGTVEPGLVYTKNVGACTTLPVYLPRALPTASGSGAWYMVAEMKDSSQSFASWGMDLATSGIPHVAIQFGSSSGNYVAYTGPSGVSAATWHTISLCTNNNDVAYGIWFDGNRLTFNQGRCAGLLTCSGLTLDYGGKTGQPLDMNAYTGMSSGADPYGGYTVIHGDPLIATIGSNGLPPMPPGGWNSP
jgi:hypothetical protein